MNRFKLFLLLPYHACGWRAELELIKRFQIVAGRIGVECYAGTSVRDARDAGADCVLALHFESPKVGPECVVGLVWNPLGFMRQAGATALIRTLTHDAHFYASDSLRDYFAGLFGRGYRSHDLGSFYPSAPRTRYEPVECFGLPTYVGVLWQKERHRDLFSRLNAAGAIHGYGPSAGWERFANVYRGTFPTDGQSYYATYRRSGVGLCLHSAEHLGENIPGMRIFEIASSGCVAICDRHPFVEKHFGNTVHYIDTNVGDREILEQITATVAEIQRRPAHAREMAEAAHRIFVRQFSLDQLLGEAVDKLALFKAKRFALSSSCASASTVEVMVRTAGDRGHLLRRALRSVAEQIYSRVVTTLIYHGPAPEEFLGTELPALRAEFPQLRLNAITVPAERPLSETVSAAMARSSAAFVAFLDDDDWYYPEHLATLVEALEKNPSAGVALSGAAVDWEWSLGPNHVVPSTSSARDTSEVLGFEPFNADSFQRGEMNICLAMLLARRSAFSADTSPWPELEIAEDRALLARLCGKDVGRCAFTSRISCTWSYRHLQLENRVDLVRSTPVVDFTYRGIRLPYLDPRGHAFARYHSAALHRHCRAAERLVRGRRWLPRRLRPLLYQRRLNRLYLAIVQELVWLGVIAGYHAEATQELARLGPGLVPYGTRQDRRNRALARMLPTHFSEWDLELSQHELNGRLVRGLERLARAF